MDSVIGGKQHHFIERIRTGVIEILRELEYTEAEKWVSENQKEYANGVFTGFEAKQGECS